MTAIKTFFVVTGLLVMLMFLGKAGHKERVLDQLGKVHATELVPVPPDQESATVTAQVYSQTAIPTGGTGATGAAATTTSGVTP